jgi:hypothetical protein
MTEDDGIALYSTPHPVTRARGLREWLKAWWIAVFGLDIPASALADIEIEVKHD